jgi:hypothetical protein
MQLFDECNTSDLFPLYAGALIITTQMSMEGHIPTQLGLLSQLRKYKPHNGPSFPVAHHVNPLYQLLRCFVLQVLLLSQGTFLRAQYLRRWDIAVVSVRHLHLFRFHDCATETSHHHNTMAAFLILDGNELAGTIPTELGMISTLGKSNGA